MKCNHINYYCSKQSCTVGKKKASPFHWVDSNSSGFVQSLRDDYIAE